MITGIVLFFIANLAITSFFNGIYSHTEDIFTILAIVIFLALAMTFLRSTRNYAWIGFIMAIILYAAIDLLAPYIGTLTFVLSLIIAITITLAIKRPMWRAMRREANRQPPRIPAWGRLLIQLI